MQVPWDRTASGVFKKGAGGQFGWRRVRKGEICSKRGDKDDNVGGKLIYNLEGLSKDFGFNSTWDVLDMTKIQFKDEKIDKLT